MVDFILLRGLIFYMQYDQWLFVGKVFKIKFAINIKITCTINPKKCLFLYSINMGSCLLKSKKPSGGSKTSKPSEKNEKNLQDYESFVSRSWAGCSEIVDLTIRSQTDNPKTLLNTNLLSESSSICLPKKKVEEESEEESSSYILQAKILTPINKSVEDTITSSESCFTSQSLYSNENLPDLMPQNFISDTNQALNISEISKNQRFHSSGREKHNKSHRINSIEDTSRLKNRSIVSDPTIQALSSIEAINGIEVPINYLQAKDYFMFLIDILQVKKFSSLPDTFDQFNLLEFEKTLKKFKFQMYPIETFNVITKALDTIFRAKDLSKNEKKRFEEIAGDVPDVEFIEKENLISSLVFRLKVIILRKKNKSTR
jgi:hypothetical protein